MDNAYTLPILCSILLGCIGIVFKFQTRKPTVIYDRPKYKGYYPYTKEFDLNGKDSRSSRNNSASEVIIVSKNNFSLMYDTNRNLIHARGTDKENSKFILTIHSKTTTSKDDTTLNVFSKTASHQKANYTVKSDTNVTNLSQMIANSRLGGENYTNNDNTLIVYASGKPSDIVVPVSPEPKRDAIVTEQGQLKGAGIVDLNNNMHKGRPKIKSVDKNKCTQDSVPSFGTGAPENSSNGQCTVAVCTFNVKVSKQDANCSDVVDVNDINAVDVDVHRCDSKDMEVNISDKKEDVIDVLIGLNNISNKTHRLNNSDHNLNDRFWFIEQNCTNSTNLSNNCSNCKCFNKEECSLKNMHSFRIGIFKNGIKLYLHASYDGEVRLINPTPIGPIPTTNHKQKIEASHWCHHELEVNICRGQILCDCGKLVSQGQNIGRCNKCRTKFCAGCVKVFCPGKHGAVKYRSIRLNEDAFYCMVCNKTYDNYYPVYGCDLCNFDVCYNCVRSYKRRSITKDENNLNSGLGFDSSTYENKLHDKGCPKSS